MSHIQRIGVTPRWSDVVIYNGIAKWVEVPAKVVSSADEEILQVLSQMDQTLKRVGSDRTRVLQVIIYLADLAYVSQLNSQWDAWFPDGFAPVRACMQAGLQSGYKIEMVIEAAVE